MLLVGMDFARLARPATTKIDHNMIGFCRDGCLVELEDRYDPADVFRLNQNLRASQSTAVPALVSRPRMFTAAVPIRSLHPYTPEES